ncbi:MAG: DUF4873 domain-containing protein [Jatrophihabitantaceae bacterium]
MSEHHEDGYQGPGQLLEGSDTVDVQVTLSGRFDPISGHYRWYGRVGASPEVTALVGGAGRRVVLRTPYGEVETALADVDPWGRPRVAGIGPAPFGVSDTLSEQSG